MGKDTARLDKYLVEAGFVSSRTLAAKLIAAGDVQVNGKAARKASRLVGPEDTLYVRQSELTEYVSRAGHKLAGALDAFPISRLKASVAWMREHPPEALPTCYFVEGPGMWRPWTWGTDSSWTRYAKIPELACTKASTFVT